MNPEKLNRYLYIEKTPTWWVRLVYLLSILAWALLLYGFIDAVLYIPFYTYFVGPLLFFFTLYYFSSYGLNLFYTQFDLKKHHALLQKYWNENQESSVDVFLPICGEDFELVKNTWEYVSKIKYKNIKVYVLDDSKSNCENHKSLAEKYGFVYLQRPNRGEMKKAGNLKYGYERSSGEFIVIFDADFAPNSDFVHELLPYMSNPKVAIVQSPQYFETTKDVHNRSPLEYGASQTQEPFYRYIQVARDKFGGAICCGSNAVYRRSALDDIGGPVQVEHSEDARTGFEVTAHGYRVLYVPIILAIGTCPNDFHSYFHQQHRWGSGTMTLCLSRDFWKAPVAWKTKLCYLVGFIFYLSQPLSILFSFQLFWGLFFYNNYISLAGGLLFYPATIIGFMVLFLFPIARFRFGAFIALLAQTYSYSHAVLSAFLKSTVGWIPTNTKHQKVSRAFKQTTLAVYIYTSLYLLFIVVGIHKNLIHFLDYNYFVVQFWIFYNLIFSCVLLWSLFVTMKNIHVGKNSDDAVLKKELLKWQIKTAGYFAVLIILLIFGIIVL